MKLHERTCTPCNKPQPRLSDVDKNNLLAMLSGWSFTAAETRIAKRYTFQKFKPAMAFANQIAKIADEIDHHPELKIGWGFCWVEIWTHRMGDLSENDFILAAKIDQLK